MAWLKRGYADKQKNKQPNKKMSMPENEIPRVLRGIIICKSVFPEKRRPKHNCFGRRFIDEVYYLGRFL